MNDEDSDGMPEPTTIPKPTEFPPGSKEKIEILRMRFEHSECLWHDDDRPLLRIEECSDHE